MSVVRELVNVIGFDVDTAAYARAEKGFDKLKDRGAKLEATTRAAMQPRGADGRLLTTGANRAGVAMDRASNSAARMGASASAAMQPRGADGRFLAAGARRAGKAAREATADFGGLRSMMVGLASFWAGAWAIRAGRQMLTLASDARETQNLLGVTFGADGQQTINAWSDNMANELGRSRDLLREYASEFGAFLKPTVGQGDELNVMAELLAKRVVDLASFRNLSEKVALEKMRAGLAGETEPLRQIGVDVSVAALEEFAKAQGLVYKSLNKAETMALRYRLIMMKTSDSQDDAANTADEYANTSKALTQTIRDIATELGERARPAVLRFMLALRDSGWEVLKMLRRTDLLASGLKAVALVAVATAVPAMVRWAMANTAAVRAMMGFARGLILFGALVILIDELNALFSGGRSLIGEYIDEVSGIGAADQFVKDHKAGVEDLDSAWESAKKAVSAFATFSSGQLESLDEKFARFVGRLKRAIKEAVAILPYGDKLIEIADQAIEGGKRAHSRVFDVLNPFPSFQVTPETQSARGLGGMTRRDMLDRDADLGLLTPGTHFEGRGEHAPLERDPYDPRERYPAPYPFAFDPAQGGAPAELPVLPRVPTGRGDGDGDGRGPLRDFRGPVYQPDDGPPAPADGPQSSVVPRVDVDARTEVQGPNVSVAAPPAPLMSLPAPVVSLPAPQSQAPARGNNTTVHMGDTHITVQASRGEGTDEVLRKAQRMADERSERERRRMLAAIERGG